MKKELVNKLIDNVKEQTALFAEQFKYKRDSLSEQAKTIKLIIEESDFECKKESVAKLISAVIGEEIPIGNGVKFCGLCMVVPLGNDNSHNYEVGKPCIRWNDDYFMRKDGTTGNHMTTTKSCVRPATNKEIDNFFKTGFFVNSKPVEKILEKFIIL